MGQDNIMSRELGVWFRCPSWYCFNSLKVIACFTLLQPKPAFCCGGRLISLFRVDWRSSIWLDTDRHQSYCANQGESRPCWLAWV